MTNQSAEIARPQGGVWPCCDGNYVHTKGPCIHEAGCRCGQYGRPSVMKCRHGGDVRWLGGRARG